MKYSLYICRDISKLEDHAYALTQRYYSQIPDWHPLGLFDLIKIKKNLILIKLDQTSDETMTIGRTTNNPDGLNVNRLRLVPLSQKLSTTSSMASIENSNFCTRLYQKCQNICCICTPNYI